jgi:hypothetical protein
MYCTGIVGLKRKFSFSYFRENFVNIFVFAFREKTYEKLQTLLKICAKSDAEIFAKTKSNATIFAKTKIKTNIFAQTKIVTKISRNPLRNGHFWLKIILIKLLHNNLVVSFAQTNIFAKIFTKTFAKTNIFTKTFVKMKFLRYEFREFSRKCAHFRLIFAKIKSSVFVLTLLYLEHHDCLLA